jgi:hypothetical protein
MIIYGYELIAADGWLGVLAIGAIVTMIAMLRRSY